MKKAQARTTQWQLLTGTLLVLDALAVWASLTMAYTVRISSGWLTYNAPHNPTAYAALSITSVPVWLALFALFGLYRKDNLMGGTIEYQQALKACSAGIILLIVMSFMWRDLVLLSRGWLIFSWGLACCLVVSERFMARRIAYGLRRHGWLKTRVLIVGANTQGTAIAHQWANTATSGMQVIGFVDDFKPVGTWVVDELKVIGRPTALHELVKQVKADEVVVIPNAIAWETFEEIIAGATAPNGYTVQLSPGFYELLTTGIAVTNKTFVPLFTIHEARIVGVDAILKTLLDYGLGSLLLLVSAPLMGLAALGLKLNQTNHPLLSCYPTVGQGGRIFKMLKFNTQVADKNRSQNNHPGFVRVLYRTGLDKLPQLFNVLSGKMSLVGPRPRVLGNEETDPRKAYNLQAVKPGMIGPWMIRGLWTSSDESRDELYYVRNWTIWLDLQILVRSAISLVLARGIARATEPVCDTEQNTREEIMERIWNNAGGTC